MYVRLSGRALINIHTANAEGAIGNYISLSKMFVVRRLPNGGLDYFEEPVISGNMLKHWHAVETVNILKSMNYGKICEYCRRYVMYRSPLKYNDEFDYIKNCAIEDLHGFLSTETNIRRESVVRFSFMVPVEDLKSKYMAITHNRVGVTKEGKIDESLMMVFKREHATGLYGFSISLDLAYVGKSQSDPSKALDIDERKLRAKAALQALANLLTGSFGASRVRAEPIIKITELVCVASKKPVPNLTHGFYKDYIEDSKSRIESLRSIGFTGESVRVYVIGDRVTQAFGELGIRCDNVIELVGKLMGDVEKWFT
ncbi:MAG: type I-A CRISPR-associated protein Cas7/Csa2 [Thermoprotei archaeon]|nr:MAG: type I-A CRISPR-associated protein Cas7/Csa2 [Thermoprotei archaeon]